MKRKWQADSKSIVKHDRTNHAKQTCCRLNHQKNLENDVSISQENYFGDTTCPKLLLATRPNPSGELYQFVGDMMQLIPNMSYYPWRQYGMKDICKFAGNEKLIQLVVLSKFDKAMNSTKLTMSVMIFNIDVVNRDWSQVKSFTENWVQSSSKKS